MELEPGFKLSEAGPIPEDWEAAELKTFLARPNQYGLNAPATVDGTPYLRITDISDNGGLNRPHQARVRHAQVGNYMAASGDLFFARTGASTGKSYRYRSEDGPLAFAGFLVRVTPDETRLLPELLEAQVRGGRFWRWLAEVSMRSGQPGVNGKQLGELVVVQPPIDEQRAIAAALGDVDGWIAAAEAEAAKLAGVKAAAMDALLTPTTRLPGFSGEWERVTLGSIAKLYQPSTLGQRDLRPGPHNVYGATGVIGTHQAYNHLHTMIAIACRGACGQVFLTKRKSWINGNAMVVDLLGSANNQAFLFQLLSLSNFDDLVTGSGQPQIVREPLAAFEILLPALAEQQAIAAVLCDIDAALAAARAVVAKARGVKAAATDALLSGRVRLPPFGPSARATA